MHNESSISLYQALCTDFFDHEKPTPTLSEYSFYAPYIQNAPGFILEPMCGAGRYLNAFFKEGYAIEGFDASPFMIDALFKKYTHETKKPIVWQQKLQDFLVTEKYSLIFIPDCSFCLFLDQVTIVQCLYNTYNALQKNGIFIFDLETVYSRPMTVGIWQGNVQKKENGDFIVCSTLPLSIENNQATVICRYELIRDNLIKQTEIEYFQIKLYTPYEMDEILQRIGFRSIKRLKAYDLSSSPAESDHTIAYECVK